MLTSMWVEYAADCTMPSSIWALVNARLSTKVTPWISKFLKGKYSLHGVCSLEESAACQCG